MISEHFRVTGTHKAILDSTDLFSTTSRGDDVQGFDTRWSEVLLSTHEVLSDSILERLYQMRIRESDQLQTALALYDQDINQKNMTPSYQRLKTMTKKFLDQKMRARNFEARNERTVTGTPAKT